MLLKRFAEVHSYALQQTLYAMGESVLQEYPEVAEIKFKAPNKHHFLVDLSPFGDENPGEVFYRRGPALRPDRGRPSGATTPDAGFRLEHRPRILLSDSPSSQLPHASITTAVNDDSRQRTAPDPRTKGAIHDLTDK